jgi:hypothetical protein
MKKKEKDETEKACENCGQRLTTKSYYLKDGLCDLCYENELLGLEYGGE